MKSSTKIAAIIAAIVIILSLLLLLFNSGMGMENMMGGGVMGGSHSGAFGWMWFPILLVVFAVAVLASFLFRKK